MSAPREILVLGDVLKLPMPEVGFSVKYKASIKADDKAGDGDGDATTTIKGREVCDVTIEIHWSDVPDMNLRMGPILKKLNPRGSEGGKPLDFAHERKALDLGDENNVRSITIRDVEDESNADEGIAKRKYSAKSWTKEVKKGAGSTPGEDGKAKFVLGSELPVNPMNYTAKAGPTKPSVKP